MKIIIIISIFVCYSRQQVIFPDGSNNLGSVFTTPTPPPFFYQTSFDIYNTPIPYIYPTPYNPNNFYTTYAPYIQNAPCICITNGATTCTLANGILPNDGSGLIDIRITNDGLNITTGSITSITSPVSSGITTIVASQSSCQYGLQLCCPPSGYQCGIRYPAIAGAPQPAFGQASYGAYPWQAIIFTTSNNYIGSGVLIDHLHILTAAHKVINYQSNGQQLKVRLGEYDVSSANEPIPSQEFTVSRIFVHSQYSATSLRNGIAILRLSSAVPIGQVPTIATGCLTTTQITGLRCWVAGWGQSSFTGSGQTVQRHVSVPIVDPNVCQSRLQTTRLGTTFQLDTNSFMCAGGEAGKDACTGDGGSPLMCPIAGKWYVVGLVAWGIGCGTTNVPGVYINVANYVNWIQTTTRSP